MLKRDNLSELDTEEEPFLSLLVNNTRDRESSRAPAHFGNCKNNAKLVTAKKKKNKTLLRGVLRGVMFFACEAYRPPFTVSFVLNHVGCGTKN